MTSDVAGRPISQATGWYAALDPKEKRTFWACFGGWALDAMDVQIFSFAIPAIIAAFRISNADAGLIGTVTLLTSAFGGWLAGALSDRFGRVRTLQVTILWFAFFTLLCGFAQSYTQLLIFRALMGFGFGALMDVWDWTYFRGSPELGWTPGMPVGMALLHFGRFYLLTSLAYDAFRAGGNALIVLLVGPPVLVAMRRMQARLHLEVLADARLPV